MTHVLLRRQALELRKLGKSYGQIRQELGVSKSTLSEWLRKYPLSKEQIRLLKDNNEIKIERYRQAMKLKREAKLQQYYNNQKKELLPISKRDLLIAGLFLYWGEGGKTLRHQVSVSNTDPAVLKFTLYWMRLGLGVSKDKIKVDLHLYKDMNIDGEIDFWSKQLNIEKSQFSRPYIKNSTREKIDQKGFGHGTCHLRVNNTVIKENILMGIKAVGDYSAAYIPDL